MHAVTKDVTKLLVLTTWLWRPWSMVPTDCLYIW